MPTQSELYVNLPGDISIGVTSNREIVMTESDELLLGAYLPDVTLEDTPYFEPDMLIHHIESSDKGLRTGRGILELRDEWGDEFPPDLPHLLYGVARTLWLQRGYFPTHAACVGMDDDFALLPGHSGVGKTTTALELVNRYDHGMLSGNTTLMHFDDHGYMQALAGTKVMTLRTEDFERGEYETNRSITYGNRTAFELANNLQVQGPKNIGRIALVRLNSGINSWADLSQLSTMHSVYSYFLDTEYADCIVAQGDGIYIGETPRDMREHLAEGLKKTLAGIAAGSGVGDVAFLAEQVAGL